MSERNAPVSHGELLQLKRWNTPTIYNGLEVITKSDRRTLTNLEDVRDFMPQMGPMIGYAITLVVETGNSKHPEQNPNGWSEYRRYVASLPGPKIVICQDLDRPHAYGSAFGEVNANMYKMFDCVGAVVDGAVRDVDEMTQAGFKTLARRLCVGHCYAHPVRWGCDVTVFGIKVQPGQLIHADKHGFLAVPKGEERGLLDASKFMDGNECDTMIATARETQGISTEEALKRLDLAGAAFGKNTAAKFSRKGEW